jgi:hypothetical protein
MFWKFKTVPVFLAGMWPSIPSEPESGTRVALIEKEGGPTILEGFTNASGDFRGRLPVFWVHREVIVVVHEPGFRYDYFNPVKVERWGLFLSIRQEKDLAYCGSMGAKSINPVGWAKWNSTQEHIRASQKINMAIRRAKIIWPLRPLGFVLAILVGVAGFFTHPAFGLIVGIIGFFSMEMLAQFLLNRGY